MVDRDEAFAGPERRATGRFPTSLAVTVRETGHNHLSATVTSLSHLGCTVTGATVRAGESGVWIRLPGLESQLARCRWATHGVAGLEFDRPLYPPVADRYNGARPVVQRPALSLVPNDDDDIPASRREQILHGRAEIPASLTMKRRPREGKATLGGLVRRNVSRIVDQRAEPRFPPPHEAQLGFRVADEPYPIHDISPSGVRVDGEFRGGIGAEVQVSFAGYTPMQGKVVWLRQGATGLRLPDNAVELAQDN